MISQPPNLPFYSTSTPNAEKKKKFGPGCLTEAVRGLCSSLTRFFTYAGLKPRTSHVRNQIPTSRKSLNYKPWSVPSTRSRLARRLVWHVVSKTSDSSCPRGAYFERYQIQISDRKAIGIWAVPVPTRARSAEISSRISLCKSLHSIQTVNREAFLAKGAAVT